MNRLTESQQYDINRLKNLIAQAQTRLQPHLSNYSLNTISYLVSYSLSEVGLYTHKNGKDIIRISAALSAETDEEILNTVFHEFAHYVTHALLHSSDSPALIFDNSVAPTKVNDLKMLLPGLVVSSTYLVLENVAVVLPAGATKIVVSKTEVNSADQSSAHGKLWQYIAELFDKKFGCNISQYYENNNLVGNGINYSEECPKCGWTQIINQQTNNAEFNMIKNFEQQSKTIDHRLVCKKCKSPLIITNINTNKVVTETLKLTEATRVQLATNSRNAGMYKDQSMGKNRFERKKHCKIAATVKQYNNIDMNMLFKQDRLEVKIPVIGETDTYNVTVRIDGVIAEIARNIKINKYKLEFRTIIQSLTKVFNTTDVFINCTCPDHLYNFEHWNIVHNCSTSDSAHDPGPGKGVANPLDDKGRGCKHSLLVLANGDWMMKVASVINNYLHYMSEKMQKPFLKLIFPKLYGCDAEEMAKLDILGKEEVEDTLETSSSFIDAINEYGKNRGKIKKGSNRNNTNRAIEEPTEDTIKTQEDPNKKNLEKAEKETNIANEKAKKDSEELDDEVDANADEIKTEQENSDDESDEAE